MPLFHVLIFRGKIRAIIIDKQMTSKENFVKNLRNPENHDFPENWQRITTIDMHTAGEPLRVFIDGYPELTGRTILEKRRLAGENYDHFRTALMWEPRGHADMYGCILSPPTMKGADFDALFLHNEGYSTMCGHAIIALTRLAVEFGLAEKIYPLTGVKINTPAGLINSFAGIDEAGKVSNIYFHNVPSFVLELDSEVEVPGFGKVKYDLAFGGAFYAYVRAKDAGLRCTPDYFNRLIEKGMLIKNAVQSTGRVKHPFENDLSFLYGTIFIDEPLENGDSRNVCIFADGEVDRSPTGTGVSGRAAIHYARREIKLNEPMVIESILGTEFKASVIGETTFGNYPAVIPRVEGMAYMTGRNEFFLDPEDPLVNGFILR
jgi:trans-L-3-hydroxyproline dehydratase